MAENKMEMDPEVLRTTAKLPEGPGGSFGNGRAVHRSGRRTPGDRR